MAIHAIRFGLQTGQQNIEWSDLVALWSAADGWGYDSLWAFDHDQIQAFAEEVVPAAR